MTVARCKSFGAGVAVFFVSARSGQGSLFFFVAFFASGDDCRQLRVGQFGLRHHTFALKCGIVYG